MNTHNVIAKYQGGFLTKRTSTEYIVIHHAAAHYKQMTGIEDVEAVRRWHMEQNNHWAGIGYHEALAEEVNGGPIASYLLSDPYTQRAHIALQNEKCYGLVMLTDFGNTIPQDKWLYACAARIRDLRVRWPNAKVVGHKDIAKPGHETRCPGDRWHEWKGKLLALAAEKPEPDWEVLWRQNQPAGMFIPYVAHFGFPAKWRQLYANGVVLGSPLTMEQAVGALWTGQWFEHGALVLKPGIGVVPLLERK
jgi:hypothetical protein